MVFLSGLQQKVLGRTISPCEKPLQQAEPVGSHPRAKKLHLDESVSGGLIVILSEKLSTNHCAHRCCSKSAVVLTSLPVLSFSVIFCCLCEALSVASLSGVGKEGVSASCPRKAGHRRAPGAGGPKAPGATSLPCLTTGAFPPLLCVSVKEP